MDKFASQISTQFYIHGLLNAHKDKQFHRLKTTLKQVTSDRTIRKLRQSPLRVSGGGEAVK